MGTRPRRRQPAVTKAALLEAARRLFLGQGYSATTMQQIASRADVTTGAIYRHFPAGKAELLLEAALSEGSAGLDQLHDLSERSDIGSATVESMTDLLTAHSLTPRQELLLEAVVCARRDVHLATIVRARVADRIAELKEHLATQLAPEPAAMLAHLLYLAPLGIQLATSLNLTRTVFDCPDQQSAARALVDLLAHTECPAARLPVD